MMVMLGNHSSPTIHFWAGKYPRSVGWLVGPSGRSKTRLREWMPYALDNDAFSAWENGTEWDEGDYFDFLDWVAAQEYSPIWAAVPDVVGDKARTMAAWGKYSARVRAYGWPVAFVVQDGMTPADVPPCSIVFLGGTYKWKWRNAERFACFFPRMHIGRVNTLGKLRRCDELGVESVDGTGWFRRPEKEFAELEEFLRGEPAAQLSLEMN
jgi:hypothetical protein